MSLVDKVREKLDELKVPYTDVGLSDRKDKKIMVVIDGKKIHYGAKDSVSYIEEPNEKKRQSYQNRSSKIKNKAGEYTYLIKYTPNFLSYCSLWS